MKTLFDNDQFCRETFEVDLANSREQIIASMTRARRRAKTGTRLRNATVVIALLISTTLLLQKTQSRVFRRQTAQSGPTFIVRTAPFSGIVHTAPVAISTVSETEPSFAIVHTLPNNHQDITDDQLLAHFKSRAVALVKSVTGARLEFLDGTKEATP